MKHAVTALLVFIVACGARTELERGTDRDGGSDASLDARFDGFVPRDIGVDSTPMTFAVECGPPQMVSPGMPIEVRASVTIGDSAGGEWLLEEAPPESRRASIERSSPFSAIVIPDVPGRFAIRFVARSRTGEEASCVAEVFSVAGPPIASCPGGELLGGVDEFIEVMGAGFDDDGPVAYDWTVVSQPRGARTLLDGVDRPTVVFSGDSPGRYVLQLTVTDVFGETDSCRVQLRLLFPPIIACDMDPIFTPTRQPVTIMLDVTDDTEVVDHQWAVVSQPPTSVAVIDRFIGSQAIFTPDKQGEYQLLYTAVDSDGLSSTCVVTVIGTPTPPTVMCPEVIETPPLTTVSVEATAEDDGERLTYRWTLSSREVGSSAAPPSPRNAPITNFTPDIAGEYRLLITVTDDDGEIGTCETTVLAVSDEGLRVEIFWNTDRTDMDLHLRNEDATRWFDDSADTDCYYANCDSGDVVEWGGPGSADNPSLDIDDTNGFGPENINIEEPEPGIYTIGVHAFSGRGGTTVRIYCGGDRTSPRAEFGPVSIGPGGPGGRDFWRVAEVEIFGPARCTVTELFSPAGGPDIIGDSAAMSGL